MNTFLGSILGILSLFSGPKTATLNEIALPDFRTGKAISYVAFDKILKEQEAARATFQVHFPGKGGSVLTYVVSPDEAVPAVPSSPSGPGQCSCGGEVLANVSCVIAGAPYQFTFTPKIDLKGKWEIDGTGKRINDVTIGNLVPKNASGLLVRRVSAVAVIGPSCAQDAECTATTAIDDTKSRTLAQACNDQISVAIGNSMHGSADEITAANFSSHFSFKKTCDDAGGVLKVENLKFNQVLNPATKRFVDSKSYMCTVAGVRVK